MPMPCLRSDKTCGQHGLEDLHFLTSSFEVRLTPTICDFVDFPCHVTSVFSSTTMFVSQTSLGKCLPTTTLTSSFHLRHCRRHCPSTYPSTMIHTHSKCVFIFFWRNINFRFSNTRLYNHPRHVQPPLKRLHQWQGLETHHVSSPRFFFVFFNAANLGIEYAYALDYKWRAW